VPQRTHAHRATSQRCAAQALRCLADGAGAEPERARALARDVLGSSRLDLAAPHSWRSKELASRVLR
jgi:hypothetical protein